MNLLGFYKEALVVHAHHQKIKMFVNTEWPSVLDVEVKAWLQSGGNARLLERAGWLARARACASN
jgi:hypothetical protein